MTFHHPGVSPQEQADAAVVMVTICRPTLLRAVQSVYRQDGIGRIHLLIGIDKPLHDRSVIDAALAIRPERCVVTLVDLGYSTEMKHGGLYPGFDGGSLRAILSFAANAPYLAYLDDDNWFAPDHLASLRAVIADYDWAFGLRWFVDAETGKELGLDTFESVGPGRGIHMARFGGFTDPNCLMIDKLRCPEAAALWARTFVLPDGVRVPSDRSVFNLLRHRPGRCTGKATCYYEARASDPNHALRLSLLAQNARP
jgi:hypothetical protein